MQRLLPLVLIVCAVTSHGQNNLNREEAIGRIASLQVKNDPFFDDGLFASTRTWFIGENDNTVFTTASVIYLLREVHTSFPDEKVKQIIDRAVPNFEKYRSRNGKAAYNTWQTVPPDLPFPNSAILSRERYRLPDDYDDTALVQLAKGPNSLDEPVRREMLRYAVRRNRTPVVTFPLAYRKFKPFEVWYADQMEQEWDIVAMSNVMLFTFKKGFELEATDLETIGLLKAIVNDRAYFSIPDKVSPYYGNPSVILYHLARLAEADSQNLLDFREILIRDLQEVFSETNSELEKILILTSLKRLGIQQRPQVDMTALLEEMESFEFFTYQPSSGFLSLLPKMRWHCEALNWAFVLEFLTYYNGEVTWQTP